MRVPLGGHLDKAWRRAHGGTLGSGSGDQV